MAIENEYKFSIDEIELKPLANFIRKIGFTKSHTLNQRDIYFDDANFTLTNLKRGLRLRKMTGKHDKLEFKSLFCRENSYLIEEIKLSNKGMLDIPKANKILNSRFSYPLLVKSNRSITVSLKNIGLNPKITLSKKRVIYHDPSKEIEICIDSFDEIGPHLEIELIGDNYDNFKRTVKKIKEFKPSSIFQVQYGYLEMVTSKIPQITDSQMFTTKFNNNNEWNVLPSEINIVKKLFQKQKY